MKASSPKIQRRHISGVFLLNKPLGISSNAALQKVRWLYRAQKAGHTGALDPLASGLYRSVWVRRPSFRIICWIQPNVTRPQFFWDIAPPQVMSKERFCWKTSP